MMRLSLETSEFNRLTCALSDEDVCATVTAADPAGAVAGLESAIDRAVRTGMGECYWLEATGEYRWLFRREGDRLRMAVLWSTGTMTGWENVFWTECALDPFVASVRAELGKRCQVSF